MYSICQDLFNWEILANELPEQPNTISSTWEGKESCESIGDCPLPGFLHSAENLFKILDADSSDEDKLEFNATIPELSGGNADFFRYTTIGYTVSLLIERRPKLAVELIKSSKAGTRYLTNVTDEVVVVILKSLVKDHGLLSLVLTEGLYDWGISHPEMASLPSMEEEDNPIARAMLCANSIPILQSLFETNQIDQADQSNGGGLELEDILFLHEPMLRHPQFSQLTQVSGEYYGIRRGMLTSEHLHAILKSTSNFHPEGDETFVFTPYLIRKDTVQNPLQDDADTDDKLIREEFVGFRQLTELAKYYKSELQEVGTDRSFDDILTRLGEKEVGSISSHKELLVALQLCDSGYRASHWAQFFARLYRTTMNHVRFVLRQRLARKFSSGEIVLATDLTPELVSNEFKEVMKRMVVIRGMQQEHMMLHDASLKKDETLNGITGSDGSRFQNTYFGKLDCNTFSTRAQCGNLMGHFKQVGPCVWGRTLLFTKEEPVDGEVDGKFRLFNITCRLGMWEYSTTIFSYLLGEQNSLELQMLQASDMVFRFNSVSNLFTDGSSRGNEDQEDGD